MDFETLIGVAASVFTATALIPQLVKLIKEKKSNDISLAMLVVLFIGLVFWIWYGFLKKDWIIIISNSFGLLVNLTIAILALHYKPKHT